MLKTTCVCPKAFLFMVTKKVTVLTEMTYAYICKY